jgi:hypothetical protein
MNDTKLRNLDSFFLPIIFIICHVMGGGGGNETCFLLWKVVVHTWFELSLEANRANDQIATRPKIFYENNFGNIFSVLEASETWSKQCVLPTIYVLARILTLLWGLLTNTKLGDFFLRGLRPLRSAQTAHSLESWTVAFFSKQEKVVWGPVI